MATVTPTNSEIDAFPYPLVVWTWGPLTNTNHDGVAIPFGKAPGMDRSIQIFGTTDSATVLVVGSNDGTNYSTLHDPLGNALSFTGLTAAGSIKQIAEVTAYINVTSSGGSGSQSITATLVSRQSKV